MLKKSLQILDELIVIANILVYQSKYYYYGWWSRVLIFYEFKMLTSDFVQFRFDTESGLSLSMLALHF